MKRKKDNDFNLVRDTFDRRTNLHLKIGSPAHRAIIGGMIKSAREKGDRLFEDWWTSDHVLARLDTAVMESELFAITAEMGDLVTHAAQSLPPQSLEAVDLPSPAGYLSLEEPLVLPDLNGLDVKYKTIIWRMEEMGHIGVPAGLDQYGDPLPEIGWGIVLYLFADMLDPDDEVAARQFPPQFLAEMPNDSLVHLMTFAFGHPQWTVAGGTGRAKVEMKSSADMSWTSQHVSDQLAEWERSGKAPTPKGLKVSLGIGEHVYMVPDPFLQWLKSAFHFIKSELVDDTRIYPPRSSLKGLPRDKVNWSPVTVVRLRRHTSDARVAGSGGKLSHRYVRRGHWRRQWYGSGDARIQRYKWIAPTIVGDVHLPFRQRSVVNLLQQ